MYIYRFAVPVMLAVSATALPTLPSSTGSVTLMARALSTDWMPQSFGHGPVIPGVGFEPTIVSTVTVVATPIASNSTSSSIGLYTIQTAPAAPQPLLLRGMIGECPEELLGQKNGTIRMCLYGPGGVDPQPIDKEFTPLHRGPKIYHGPVEFDYERYNLAARTEAATSTSPIASTTSTATAIPKLQDPGFPSFTQQQIAQLEAELLEFNEVFRTVSAANLKNLNQTEQDLVSKVAYIVPLLSAKYHKGAALMHKLLEQRLVNDIHYSPDMIADRIVLKQLEHSFEDLKIEHVVGTACEWICSSGDYPDFCTGCNEDSAIKAEVTAKLDWAFEVLACFNRVSNKCVFLEQGPIIDADLSASNDSRKLSARAEMGVAMAAHGKPNPTLKDLNKDFEKAKKEAERERSQLEKDVANANKDVKKAQPKADKTQEELAKEKVIFDRKTSDHDVAAATPSPRVAGAEKKVKEHDELWQKQVDAHDILNADAGSD